MNKAMSLLLYALFMAPAGFVLYAQEQAIESRTLKEKLSASLEKIQETDTVEFAKNIQELNEQVFEYAQLRRKECMGEYSSFEITSDGRTKATKNKLTKEERRLCLLDLVKVRKEFSSKLFALKRKLLVKNHQEQIEGLKLLEERNQADLEAMANQLK